MAIFQIILISVFGVGAIALFIIVIKSIRSPKKISTIKNLLQQGKTSNAIKIAKAIIANDNRDIAAHYYLGKAYLLDKKDELALMEFKIVNKSAIFDAMDIPEKEFRHACAQLLRRFNHIDEALNEYILLTKLDPINPEVYFEAAKLFEQKKKFENALGYYNKTLQLNQRHGKAHGARGMLLFRAKQYPEARKAIELALQISPDVYANYYYLGKILKEAKDYPGAVEAFEKATRDADFRQKALIERGTTFLAANNIEKAKVEFDRAINISKGDDTNETLFARYFLASCFERERNIDKAVEQWNIINKKNKNFKDVPAKLNEYKKFNDNDSMKEYLTCSDSAFLDMCKLISLKAFGLSSQNASSTNFGCELIATEKKDSNWMDGRKKLSLLVFYRETKPIEESILRNLLDKAKKQKCSTIFLFTSSEFARAAINFAENRPIELIGNEKLQQLLDKVGV